MTADERDQGLSAEQIDAITGDDIAYWLGNAFMTPELLADKVRYWINAVVAERVREARGVMDTPTHDQARCPDCGHAMRWHIVECGHREFDQRACPCTRPADQTGDDR